MAGGSAGFHHPAVHATRLLHQKKHRLEERCFLVEGPSLLAAASAAKLPISRVFVRADMPLEPSVREALPPHTDVWSVDQRTLESLAQTKTPQGIVAVVPFIHHRIDELAKLVAGDQAALVLVLHDLSDPGNAGTLLRSAEAFGAAAVCFGGQAVEPYNDKVVRASMGSLFRIPIVGYEEWAEFREAARKAGLTPIAAEAQGRDVRSVTLPSRIALLVGQERRGTRDVPAGDLLAAVGLPQKDGLDSLNAAVAGSIMLYELGRARGLLGTANRGTSGA